MWQVLWKLRAQMSILNDVLRQKIPRFWRGSNSRPSACKADVITTTPQNPLARQSVWCFSGWVQPGPVRPEVGIFKHHIVYHYIVYNQCFRHLFCFPFTHEGDIGLYKVVNEYNFIKNTNCLMLALNRNTMSHQNLILTSLEWKNVYILFGNRTLNLGSESLTSYQLSYLGKCGMRDPHFFHGRSSTMDRLSCKIRTFWQTSTFFVLK